MKLKNHLAFHKIIGSTIAVCLTPSIHAADGVWVSGGSSELWSDTSNWVTGTPAGGAGAAASFEGTGSSSIQLDAPVTLGSLRFATTADTSNWTLSSQTSPAHGINLTRASGAPSIEVATNTQADLAVALSGTSGFSKTGAGTLLLSAINPLAGPVTVADGKLSLNGSGQVGNVHLSNASSTFDLSAISANHLSLTHLSGVQGSSVVLGSRTLEVAINNIHDSNSFAGNLSGSQGGLVKSGAGTLSLEGTNSYTGSTTVNAGKLDLKSRNALYQGQQDQWTKENITVKGGATLQLSVGGANGFTEQDVDSMIGEFTQNVAENGLQSGSTIGLDTSTASGGTFSLATGIHDSSGTGAGSLGLLKTGSNTLELTGQNSYTGSTTLEGGTLKFSGAADITLSRLNAAQSTTLDLASAEGNIAIRSINAAGSINLGGRSVAIGSANGLSEISGNVSGTGGNITKTGVGTLTLSGTNAYSGTTSIANGTLLLGKTTALYGGDITKWTKANIAADAGATLAIKMGGTGGFSASNANTLLSNLATGTEPGGLKAGSSIGFDTTDAPSGNFTLTSAIADRSGEGAGSIGLVKLGSGTLQLDGAHSYTGTTRIEAGTLRLGRNALLSSQSSLNLAGAAAVFELDDRTPQTMASISGVAGSQVKLGYNTLRIGSDNSSTTFAGAFVGSYGSLERRYYGGNVTKLGTGTLTLTGANLNAGEFRIAGGTVEVVNEGSLYWGSTVDMTGANSRLDISGITASNQTIRSLAGVSGSSVEIGNKTLTFGAVPPFTSSYTYDGSGAFAGNISGNDGNVVKSSVYPGYYSAYNGIQVLGGVNTYTGSTTVLGGTLQFARQESLYNHQEQSWTKEKITVGSGAAIAFNVGGSGEFTTENVTTLLNNLTTNINQNGLKGGSLIGFDTTNAVGGTFTIADNIGNSSGTGSGSLGLVKLGSNTLELTGQSTYSGETNIKGGTLRFVTNRDLNFSNLESASGSTMDLSNATGGLKISSIYSDGSLNLGGNHVEININSYYDGWISGDVSGNDGSVTKTGSGSLYLTGNNSYTGTTRIEEGKVQFWNKSSLYAGDPSKWNKQNLTLNAGATLALGVGHESGFSSSDVSALLASLGTNVTTGGLKAGSTLELANTYVGSGTFTHSGNIADSSGSAGGQLGLALTSGSGWIGYNSNDRIVLSGTNTYTGRTEINGVAQFATRNSLYGGDTSKWTRSNISVDGELAVNMGGAGQFTASDVSTLVGNLRDPGDNTGGGLSVGETLGIDTSAASASLGNQDYLGTESLYLRKLGSNTLTINNSQLKGYAVEGGTLRLTGGQTATYFNVDQNATLQLSGNATIPTGSYLAGYGKVDISGMNSSGLNIGYTNFSSFELGSKTLTVAHNKGVINPLGFYSSSEDFSYLYNVSGTGGSVIKTGTGTLVIDETNTYTGTTAANGGILVMRGTSTSLLEVNSGGRLLLNGTNTGNAVVNGGRLDVGNTLDSETQRPSGYYGTLDDGSWNNYQFLGSGNQLTGNATVKSGGTLGGHGTIAGTVTVEAGGLIAPGTSIGSLTSGTVTFASNSTYQYEVDSSALLAAGADLLVIQGDLNLNMTQLAFSNIAATPESFEVGTLFSLLNYTGSRNDGLFAIGGNVLTDGEQFFAGMNYWRINYDAQAGGMNFADDQVVSPSSRFINLTATAIPEPSVALLTSLVGLTLLRRRKIC